MATRTLDEIERQIKALQAQAEEIKQAEGIEQLSLIIRKYGVGLAQFKLALEATQQRKQTGKKLPPTHRNPYNDAETWTGRGRKPRWLTAALSSGKTVDQYRISHPAQAELRDAH
jgi:DNA-binding protein H-NS